MKGKVLALVALAIVIAALAAGCSSSGSKKVAPEGWMGTLCQSVRTWQGEISKNQPDTSGTNLTAIKKGLVDYLDTVVKATDTMVHKVEDAGTPNVDSGDQISSQIVTKLKDVQKIFSDAKTTADNLPTDDPTKFSSEADSLGTKISDGGNKAGQAISDVATKYKKGGQQLATAGSSASACSALSSSDTSS